MRYATVNSWVGHLKREEGIGISNKNIFKRLKKAKVIGVSAKDGSGRLLNNQYYSELDVRNACSDILTAPRVDGTGCYIKNDIRYASITFWSKKLQISPESIKRRLKKSKCLSIRVWTATLKADMYSESDIYNVCSDLLDADIPQADDEGFFEIEGIKYGTFASWARELSVSGMCLKERILKINPKSVQGKDKQGKLWDFYSEVDIRISCPFLLKDDLPQADEDGYYLRDGEKYGPTSIWSEDLQIGDSTIKKFLDKFGFQPEKGRNRRGALSNYYPESAIRSACSHLMGLARADESGFLEIGGIKYGVLRSWAKKYSIPQSTLKSRLKESAAESIRGRDRRGGAACFYSESDVHSACNDFIEEIPQADKSGFFEIRGVRHGSLRAYSNILPISEPTIKKYLKINGVKPAQGKDCNGHLINFYLEPDVYSACSNLLEELPQADKTGFFTKDGIVHGAIGSFVRKYGLSISSVKLRIKRSDMQGIKGRSIKRAMCTFYPEPDVRSVCADLLQKPNPKAA